MKSRLNVSLFINGCLKNVHVLLEELDVFFVKAKRCLNKGELFCIYEGWGEKGTRRIMTIFLRFVKLSLLIY